MTDLRFPRMAALKTADSFRRHLSTQQIDLGFDDTLPTAGPSALRQSLTVGGRVIGNRFCVLPMEGWDGDADGRASDLTARRWRRFGLSGAKLIWGGEAVAVCPDGRANPNQLVLTEATASSIEHLRQSLLQEHRAAFGPAASADLLVGLQLTHSGRFSKPRSNTEPEPQAAYAHPLLDRRFRGGIRILSDGELDRIADRFVSAARLARDIGFDFVDVKQCHGYLLHELLSARERAGKYGGSLENRTRFMRTVIERIHHDVPGVAIGVRLSVFDTVPYGRGASTRGEPEVQSGTYTHGFGLLTEDEDLGAALGEARTVLAMLRALDVRLICTTAGSPYYCPHVQRPAAFPPSDGYQPPEDPLRGVARQVTATALLKAEFPDLVFTGSGYSYLQEWLPNVAEFNVRTGRTDFVGLGRSMLSYPQLPADVLAGRPLLRKSICRTFSDCTTGPRLGLVSGCYPLDPFYEAHADAQPLRNFKAQARP
jgi:NADPH2 dehydrogenase